MNPYNQYQQNEILTASPEQILLMLYDGAIRFTHQAISGLENEDLPQVHRGIKNSMAIIHEFSNSLDHAIGGKIADDLAALYDYMVRTLIEANLHKDKEKLKIVEKILVELRGAWGEAIASNNTDRAMAKGLAAIPKIPEKGGLPPANYAGISILG